MMSAQPMDDAGIDAAWHDGDRPQFSLYYVLRECVRSALSSIRAHGLRSFLTMLGIVIGVAAVICVIALVQGLSKSISQQFQDLGGNALTLRANTSFEDFMRGKVSVLRATDADELRNHVEGISNITITVFAGHPFGSEVRNGQNRATAPLYGTTPSYQDVQQTFPKSGRFLTASDNASRRRVAVIGEQLRRDLKLPENAVGHFIQIGDEWFKVVGVMEPRGEMFGQSQDRYLVMPYETALAITGVISQPNLWISFTVNDVDAVDQVRQRVTGLMRQVHHLKDHQPADFVVEAADALARTFKQLSSTVTLVIASVASIALVVGGVGIMNIMLVSVNERTREIGIAKALGAPRYFVLLQFLIEATVLAVIGGLIGIVLGLAAGFGIANAIPKFPPPSVPWWAVLGACLFSILIGMIFGILPARKAANLAPIDALRYE